MITREADYAIRMIQYLADHYDSSVPATAKDISEVMEIPYRHLRLIAGKLSNAGILKSWRGSSGGYWLNKDPQELSLFEVLEAIAPRSFMLNMCMDKNTPCHRASYCKVHEQLENLQENVNKSLSNIYFDQLKQGR
ncbi:HTH-type transcriptional repressor NsrR [Limihaloglobus sulfuriphilus]|uniref:HTH-type transcriptional repressor NsrR n=1 Tax=Limihaloglobus sulfuriphilus TaxID=1851148 RepID=A0A1Q2MDS1_9BACT|nr:Rrf2 family transcriptional regulator [Limihaloglobus sulfuriphilus]AQQ70412.1 HTH-type transcriptional repressor NsrR [Limihaloglobus sulfuriphilus]